MADEDIEQKQPNEQQEQPENRPKKGKLLPVIILVVVVLVCAGAGFAVGRVIAGRGQSGQESSAEHAVETIVDASAEPDTTPGWYYELEPVVANLNEPGVTRYARVSLILEISGAVDSKKATATFDQKKPILKHWLNLYLANQTIEDIRGEKNLRRLQTQIQDAFNEKFAPEYKSAVKRVLFKEFAIQ